MLTNCLISSWIFYSVINLSAIFITYLLLIDYIISIYRDLWDLSIATFFIATI
jgi:hypothetical protein